MEGTDLMLSLEPPEAFPKLVWLLQIYITHGRTVELKHFRSYYERLDGMASISAYRAANWL